MYINKLYKDGVMRKSVFLGNPQDIINAEYQKSAIIAKGEKDRINVRVHEIYNDDGTLNSEWNSKLLEAQKEQESYGGVF